MEKFIVITSNNPDDFQNKVNNAINKGYKIHGNSDFKVTSHQDTWNKRQRSLHKYHYSQCMVLSD